MVSSVKLCGLNANSYCFVVFPTNKIADSLSQMLCSSLLAMFSTDNHKTSFVPNTHPQPFYNTSIDNSLKEKKLSCWMQGQNASQVNQFDIQPLTILLKRVNSFLLKSRASLFFTSRLLITIPTTGPPLRPTAGSPLTPQYLIRANWAENLCWRKT